MATFHPAATTQEDDIADLRRVAVDRLRKKRDLQAPNRSGRSGPRT